MINKDLSKQIKNIRKPLEKYLEEYRNPITLRCVLNTVIINDGVGIAFNHDHGSDYGNDDAFRFVLVFFTPPATWYDPTYTRYLDLDWKLEDFSFTNGYCSKKGASAIIEALIESSEVSVGWEKNNVTKAKEKLGLNEKFLKLFKEIV